MAQIQTIFITIFYTVTITITGQERIMPYFDGNMYPLLVQNQQYPSKQLTPLKTNDQGPCNNRRFPSPQTPIQDKSQWQPMPQYPFQMDFDKVAYRRASKPPPATTPATVDGKRNRENLLKCLSQSMSSGDLSCYSHLNKDDKDELKEIVEEYVYTTESVDNPTETINSQDLEPIELYSSRRFMSDDKETVKPLEKPDIQTQNSSLNKPNKIHTLSPTLTLSNDQTKVKNNSVLQNINIKKPNVQLNNTRNKEPEKRVLPNYNYKESVKGKNSEERSGFQYTEPALTGVSLDSIKSRMMVIESDRVCYACSTMSDISCWRPSRLTMVKYCKKGIDACVTKTYKNKHSDMIVIRDCSDTKHNPILMEDQFQSCSICTKDLCNFNYVENSASVMQFRFFYIIILISAFKFLL